MPGKHVIFLGAGASASSGYPLAYDLTLRMISREHRDNYCYQLFKRHFFPEGADFIEKIKVAVDFFARGAFASVDEFCKLAADSPEFVGYVPQLKQLMRLILSINNPLDNFENDYRFMVNRLIANDGVSLRDDVAILSYNYDPHLDYLLAEAVNTRFRIKSSQPNGFTSTEILDSVTSGYWSHGGSNWKDQPGFCHLKLHGTLAYPHPAGQSNAEIVWNDLFIGTYAHRVKRLSNPNFHVPCIFPWEMLKADQFLDASEFCIKVARVGCGKHSHTVFRDTWERARSEVMDADRISFVGLSMHQYLEDGLRYLFFGRRFPPRLVYSVSHGNKNVHPKSGRAVDMHLTPAWKTAKFFRDNFKHWRISDRNARHWEGDIKIQARESFHDFIEKDL